MEHKKVIVIGGGLAGLYAAHRLEQLHVPYGLFETKCRLGGRILGMQSTQDKECSYDLGPTWIFPHQTKIQSLLKELGVTLFRQFSDGDALFQGMHSQLAERMSGTDTHALYKVKKGMPNVIKALERHVNENNLKLAHKMLSIDKEADFWKVTFQHKQERGVYRAEKVILAMPPRITAEYLLGRAWVPDGLVESLKSSQTWMSGQAKFLVSYPSPFWRQQRLSGQIFSQVGPMVEVHDASASEIHHFALFGFIGWPVARRAKLSEEELKQACLKQLEACYGKVVYNFSQCSIKDWANDQDITTSKDISEPSRHPEFQITPFKRELDILGLYLTGSEFAHSDPGYLEGAIDAVDASIRCLSQHFTQHTLGLDHEN